MTNVRRWTLTIPVVLLGAALLALAGCANIERETGLSTQTQTGAAAGAAAGGILAALADANPGWIVASALLGGASGGAIAHYLGEHDTKKEAQAHVHALDTLGAGQSENWSDPQTGNSGTTTVTRVTEENGQTCKAFRQTVHAGPKTYTDSAVACKSPGGTWKVQS